MCLHYIGWLAWLTFSQSVVCIFCVTKKRQCGASPDVACKFTVWLVSFLMPTAKRRCHLLLRRVAATPCRKYRPLQHNVAAALQFVVAATISTRHLVVVFVPVFVNSFVLVVQRRPVTITDWHYSMNTHRTAIVALLYSVFFLLISVAQMSRCFLKHVHFNWWGIYIFLHSTARHCVRIPH